uniref:ParB/RepB/Spo0J family partition protein n=1 Tax=Amycolatopsis sp. CA-096443 TaxID=3239919 RepID=UPI003F495B82
MALDVQKPGKGTKGGSRGSSPSRRDKSVESIYDVKDGNWDLLDIPLTDISPNPFNKREMGDLGDLAAEIAAHGMDTPVSLMLTADFVAYWGERYPEECSKLKTKYVLGFGERRWRSSVIAAETTGLLTIRAHLRNDMIAKIRIKLFSENYWRKDPTPLEKARHVKELRDDENMGYAEICEALAIKSKGTVSKLLDLLELPEVVQQAVDKDKFPQKTALAMAGLSDDEAAEALRLIRKQEMAALDAIHHVSTTSLAVSPGNEAPVPRVEEPKSEPAEDHEAGHDQPLSPSEHAAPTSPHNVESAPAAGPSSVQDHQPSSGSSASSSDDTTRPAAPASVKSAADASLVERKAAAQARERACVQWLSHADLPPAEQRGRVEQQALLVGKSDGRARAHGWLVRVGKAHFDIKETDSYFSTVLASADSDLINRTAWAVGLANCEIRAADRRRPSWDGHDAAYVRELIDAVGYVPGTQWEQTMLERHAVSPGNTTDERAQETE